MVFRPQQHVFGFLYLSASTDRCNPVSGNHGNAIRDQRVTDTPSQHSKMYMNSGNCSHNTRQKARTIHEGAETRDYSLLTHCSGGGFRRADKDSVKMRQQTDYDHRYTFSCAFLLAAAMLTVYYWHACSWPRSASGYVRKGISFFVSIPACR